MRLHARPAARFAKLAGKYSAAITATRGDRTGNAKSLVEIVRLEAQHVTL